MSEDDFNIKFFAPQLARCDNRAVIAAENPIILGPNNWVDEIVALDDNIIAASFDFFVDWTTNPLAVQNEFWFKFPVTGDVGLEKVDEDVLRKVLRCNQDFVALSRLCRKMNLEAKAIMFNADEDYKDSTSVVVFTVSGIDKTSSFEFINLLELKNRIKGLSGGSISIGRKGLMYGTTRLECFLSGTDALWPGDADLMIYAKDSDRILALFEFKKHTRQARATFEQQDISLYYPRPDGRKYNRLMALSQKFDYDIPVYLVFYCNFREQTELIVQRLVSTGNGIESAERFTTQALRDAGDVARVLLELANP
jgi:hypothetical protein